MAQSRNWLAFSVDLEPNKDGTFDNVAKAMAWYDATIPQGTVYATHAIAVDRPDMLARLAGSHEVGVHVHPREFGHEHDQLAELPPQRQRELIQRTRVAIADATGSEPDEITTFRAGRHSASESTLSVLSALGFEIDASANVRYDSYLPNAIRKRIAPFKLDNGLFEIPTSYCRPPLLSRPGLRTAPGRHLTATANTVRSDQLFCSGSMAIQYLFSALDGGVSMYMHPYDATSYHSDLENAGATFRTRIEQLVDWTDRRFVTATDLLEAERDRE